MILDLSGVGAASLAADLRQSTEKSISSFKPSLAVKSKKVSFGPVAVFICEASNGSKVRNSVIRVIRSERRLRARSGLSHGPLALRSRKF